MLDFIVERSYTVTNLRLQRNNYKEVCYREKELYRKLYRREKLSQRLWHISSEINIDNRLDKVRTTFCIILYWYSVFIVLMLMNCNNQRKSLMHLWRDWAWAITRKSMQRQLQELARNPRPLDACCTVGRCVDDDDNKRKACMKN